MVSVVANVLGDIRVGFKRISMENIRKTK